MLNYTDLKMNRRKLLALSGLTPQEFEPLSAAFSRSYDCLYPIDQTVDGRPRQRFAGGGRQGALPRPGQKLLFILVYLKTYPLQVVLGELFGLSQSQANHWIHRLLPVLRSALDESGVLPERDPTHFAQRRRAPGAAPRLIIDGTERRRPRPKNPGGQAAHYSGKKKAHCDKNLVVFDSERKRIDFLSRTDVGKTHDKKMADQEPIAYPPETELYKDTGFQGYEPAVKRTCQAKKKATRGEPHAR
jgi:Helix-turn-helix of DDE superfamily endonuclease/DDE superfamily endonuclease